jgi:hypothetical protein
VVTLKDYIRPFVAEDKELPHTLWFSDAFLCDYASNLNYNVHQTYWEKCLRTHEHITTFISPKVVVDNSLSTTGKSRQQSSNSENKSGKILE